MADSKTPLESNNFYHVFNHAVGNEILFKSDRNYLFFLDRFNKYLSDYIDLYCYCLLPNHFHLLFQTKSEENILAAYYSIHKKINLKADLKVSEIISRQFSHFFNSYAQAYNKENNRKGSLFYNRFKRKLVDDDKYLIKLIHYVHFNPVRHGIADNIEDWKYSSYLSFFSTKETFIKRKEVVELFNDIQNFKFCHTVEPIISGIDDI